LIDSDEIIFKESSAPTIPIKPALAV